MNKMETEHIWNILVGHLLEIDCNDFPSSKFPPGTTTADLDAAGQSAIAKMPISWPLDPNDLLYWDIANGEMDNHPEIREMQDYKELEIALMEVAFINS